MMTAKAEKEGSPVVLPRERLLRISAVAERLDCHRDWVYRLAKRGDLTLVQIGRERGFRITESSLERFLASRI